MREARTWKDAGTEETRRATKRWKNKNDMKKEIAG